VRDRLSCWGPGYDWLGRRVPQVRHAGLRSDPDASGWKAPRRRRTRKLSGRVFDQATRSRWAVSSTAAGRALDCLGIPRPQRLNLSRKAA
jgi:hypothetical protein